MFGKIRQVELLRHVAEEREKKSCQFNVELGFNNSEVVAAVDLRTYVYSNWANLTVAAEVKKPRMSAFIARDVEKRRELNVRDIF